MKSENQKKPFHLVLFFSRGVSLEIWEQSGMFDREVRLYQELQKQGLRVSFITYGGIGEKKFLDRLEGVSVGFNRWGLPETIYSRLISLLHARLLASADCIKSNQFDGAEAAWYGARVFRKQFVARGGYLWSDFVRRKWGEDSPRAREILTRENRILDNADRIVVSAPVMKQELLERSPGWETKMHVIPNYVDTEQFKPADSEKVRDILFVGRIVEQKNLRLLLEAVRGTSHTLGIVGEGDLKESLQKEFEEMSGQVTWMGNLPSGDLPREINRSRLFVLPSHYEGLPKALLEAMACGACVVATAVDGIREVVEDGVNGKCVEPDPAALRECVDSLLQNDVERGRLGGNACKTIRETYALEKVAIQERALYIEDPAHHQ